MSGAAQVDLFATIVGEARRDRRKKKRKRDKVITVTPKSADEIGEILTDPGRYPAPVRPTGSGSSTTRATRMASGTRIDMTALTHVLGRTPNTVTVQAGIRIGDLVDHLAEDGYELETGCSNLDRTVGGAISSPTWNNALDGDAGAICGRGCQPDSN